MKLKHIAALLFTLGGTFVFMSCGGGSSANSAATSTDALDRHLSTPSNQRDFATYNEINGSTSAPSHDLDGKLVSPLKDKFLASAALDQGHTNSCVTLSVLGAIGIILDYGATYYNPVCSLNLGNYLHYDNNYQGYEPIKKAVADGYIGYYPSGWNGSTLELSLAQAETFGLARAYSNCGSDSFLSGSAHTNAVEPTRFATMSTNIAQRISTTTICSNNSHSSTACQCTDTRGCVDSGSIINGIKSVIDSGGVALISAALHPNLPNHGLSKSYYMFNKSKTEPNVWSYGEDVQNCRENKDAKCQMLTHEMIVYGYIDHPTNADDGLLLLRNSWGIGAGDDGNYYMTYKYAQKELLEVVQLSKKH